ncbi:MAG: energy transducer TonB [Selenomonas sp.]|nr:energy transducer TonB [Selenomonas sp.]
MCQQMVRSFSRPPRQQSVVKAVPTALVLPRIGRLAAMVAARGNGAASGGGSGNGNGGDAGAGGNASAPPVPTERITAVCTYRPDPVYPESLRAQGAEGRVQVRIMVAADDSIEGVEVLSSSGYPAMDQAALRAAWGCRFQMNGYLGALYDYLSVCPDRRR